jgi:hypothetical protein
LAVEEENQPDARPIESLEREEAARLIEVLEDIEGKVMDIILSK